MCYQLVVKTGISSGEYIIDTALSAEEKRTALPEKTRPFLEIGFTYLMMILPCPLHQIYYI